MRAFILLSACFLCVSGPQESLAGADFQSAMRSMFKSGSNESSQTEASVPKHCTDGSCTDNPHANEPLGSLPHGTMADGVPRVLATIYGACVRDPLPSIDMDPLARNGAYNTYMAVDTAREAAVEPEWKLHVPGLASTNRDLREITDPAAYNSGGPYASDVRNNACRDTTGANVIATPKTFGFGASGVMNKNGEYDILRCGNASFVNRLRPEQKASVCGLAPNSQPAIAIDCAEFIGAAAVASCKKLHKYQDLKSTGFEFPVEGYRRELSTASMVDSARLEGDSSCLTNTPEVGPNGSIMPGDIFAGSGEHSIMITKVGSDPLGINKAKNRPGGCDSLSYNDLDFSMAHSPSHDAIGPINSTAKAYANLLSEASKVEIYPLNKIISMAIVMCKRQKRGPAQTFMEDPGFSLLRHKGGADCSYSADECPKLAGDDCANECGV